jgi:hypothetical protein
MTPQGKKITVETLVTIIVFYLNPLSTRVWQLLKEPISVFDAANIVHQDFPEMSPSKITRDVLRLINDMSKKNLVLNDE